MMASIYSNELSYLLLGQEKIKVKILNAYFKSKVFDLKANDMDIFL